MTRRDLCRRIGAWCALTACDPPRRAFAAAGPIVGKPAPDFTLLDVQGRHRSLHEYRGRPTCLFLLCGCIWCMEVAREWAALQHVGALDAPHVVATPSPTRPQATPPERQAGLVTQAPLPPSAGEGAGGRGQAQREGAAERGQANTVAASGIRERAAERGHANTLIVFAGESAEAIAFRSDAGLDPATTVMLCDPDVHVTDDLYHVETCPRVFVLDPSQRLLYTNAGPDDRPREGSAAQIVARALAALQASMAAARLGIRAAG
jgi:hypothetical protein